MTIKKSNKRKVYKKCANPRGIVTTVLKPAELDYLADICETAGCSPSEALRAVARLGIQKLSNGGRVDEQQLTILFFGNIKNEVEVEGMTTIRRPVKFGASGAK